MAVSTVPASAAIHGGSRTKSTEILTSIIKYGLLLVLGFTFVLPFVWMFSSALKDDPQVYTIPPIWIPHPLSLIHI